MAVALRTVIAFAVAAICIFGIAWERERWSLDAEKLALERTTGALWGPSSQSARTRFARTALERLDARQRHPLDVDLRLEAAAAFRLIGQFEAAEREYRAALRVSDRPEIHIALGYLLVEMGDIESALDHHSYAVQFSRHYVRYVVFRRPEVLRRVEQRERELATAAHR